MKTPLLNTDNHWNLWKQLTDIDNNGQRPAIFHTWHFQQDKDKQETLKKYAKRTVALTYSTAKSRFIHSRPRFKETYITQTYLDMIASAQKEVIIVNAYFIPSEAVRQALKKAAKERNVKVTIITNSKETNNHSIGQTVSQSMYYDILTANKNDDGEDNVAIYEWRGDLYQEGTLHAKFALFDQRAAIVGAYNIDPRGDSLNSETVIVFENTDLVAELKDMVVSSDIKKSQKISLEQAKAFHKPPDIIDALKLKLAGFFKSQL